MSLQQRAASSTISFDDIATAAQLGFHHNSPLSAERHIHLYMGSGLAWADFDRDGRLDLFFCQGSSNPVTEPDAEPAVEVRRGETGENSPIGMSRTGRGSRERRMPSRGYCRRFRQRRLPGSVRHRLFSAALYRNNGDGTFLNRTVEAGIVPCGFGSGCCWTDLDSDGNLDLIYVRYVKIDSRSIRFVPRPSKVCREIAMGCGPKRFAGEPDSVYRNLGNGKFDDITASSGFARVEPRHGLGCVAQLDLDDDGSMEIYTANDGMPNDLWKNRGDLQFEEWGMFAVSGAVNRFGKAEAGMGIAAGDVNGDLRPDLFVTNFFDETNTLYRNEGNLLFLDVTEPCRLAGPSRNRLGFGTNFVDFDNDGWLDLYVANGHVQDQLHLVGIKDEPFAQLSQVFSNIRGRSFEEVSPRAGPFFQAPWVARGSAAADFDGDGRMDLAVLRLNDRVALWKTIRHALGTGWLLNFAVSSQIATRSERP